MNKYRIIFINSAKEWGGNERWTVSACNALAERGHEVVLAYRKDIFSNRLNDKVEMLELPLKHEVNINTYQKLDRFNKKFKSQFLFPTKRKDYAIAGLYARYNRVGVILRHGIIRNISKYDVLQRFVLSKLSDKIVVNAKIIKDSFIEQKITKPEKLEVVYNGYDFTDDYAEWNPPKNIDNKIIFAAAGRLAPQKGFDILLEAMKKLKKKRDNFHLFIAGDGEKKSDYEKYINENDLSNNITLLGNIDNVLGLFANSDCVVIPSRAEGIPNTLMEAWSVKTPVIAAKSAGIPEAVQHEKNGLLFDLNVDAIEHIILKIVDNRSILNEYGEKGYETLQNQFTIKKMTDSLEKVFDKVKLKKRLK